MSSWIELDSFSSYPAEGRALAANHIETLRRLPTALLPVFLVELKTYDWQFPIEQQEINRRLAYVEKNPASLSSFFRISVPRSMERPENIAVPQRFLAAMSAYLWSSLQMDAYRQSAMEFMRLYRPDGDSAASVVPRLAVIVIGQGATASPPLFQKLAGHGQIRTNVSVEDGMEPVLEVVRRRSAAHPQPYAHWYVDGGDPLPGIPGDLAQLSWPALTPMNRRVLDRIQACIANGSGPEVLQQELAELPLHGLAAGEGADDPRLQHFALSLFTEGSGTQIFATTFVQAAMREILRRAQPVTLFARFAPRQRQKAFNAMVEDVAHGSRDLDPNGSLVDADMAAYYAYLELMQLSGASQSSLLVWFEGHPLVFVAGPQIPKNTSTGSPCTLGGTFADLLTGA
jgi:hypothetical protein